MNLERVQGRFAVCRLPARSACDVPADARFYSVTRSPDELSVVCEEHLAPASATVEGGWACLRVAGTLAFNEVGVLSALATPLAEAGISLFVVSSFDTDYLLIKTDVFAQALGALARAGHRIKEAG